MCSHTCAHTLTHSHSPGLAGVLTCSLTHGLSQATSHSRSLTPPQCIPHPQNRLIITRSLSPAPLAPTLTGTDPRGNTIGSFTPDTLPPPVPASPPPKAHQPARLLHPLAHPPTPHPPARSLRLPQSPPPPRRPAPQPVHTYGKLPKVAAFPPPPPARGGPLSGYQEVNGECPGGGSSTLPVR